MIDPKEQTILVAYDPDALARLAEAFDAFSSAKQRDELRTIVERGRVPVSERRREKAAAEYERLRGLGAPAVLLRNQDYLRDPKAHVLGRIRDHDGELTFEELCPFIRDDRLAVWSDGISWGLAPSRRAEVERMLAGSAICVLGGRPRFPHWREQLPQDAKQLAQDEMGEAWNYNFHSSSGVEQAHDLLGGVEGPMATTEDAADCPSYRSRMILMHGYPRRDSVYTFGGARSPWPEDPRPEAAKALRIVAKQFPRLRGFFEACHARGRHVHCQPRDR